MVQTNPYVQYRNTGIQTASPEKLLLMLFEGAIKFGHQGLEALQKKNWEKANYFIGRVQDIVSELMSTLKMEYSISNNLLAIYEYCFHRLIEANVKKDEKPLMEVINHLQELHDAFAQAAVTAKAGSNVLKAGEINFEG